LLFCHITSVLLCGPGSSVGIATRYGLDGLGSNPGGDEIFRPSRPAQGVHPASCKMGIRSFPGVKCGWGVLLTTHHLLVPQSWKSRAIRLGHTGPVKGKLNLFYTSVLLNDTHSCITVNIYNLDYKYQVLNAVGHYRNSCT